MNRFEYLLPSDLSEAESARKAGAVLKAGGIDLLDRMKEGLLAPARLASLACGQGEPAVRPDGGDLVVSAFAMLAAVAGHDGIRAAYPALAAAAGEAATPHIRNQATVAGNVLQENRCWYYRLAEFDCLRKGGEGCPAREGENEFHAILGYGECPAVHASNLAPVLLALRATFTLHGGSAPRPVAELFTGPPDGVVTAFRLPPCGPNAYVEVRHRKSFDFALASAAVAVVPGDGFRIVLGAVAPTPHRAPAAEKALGTGKPTAKAIAKAADLALRDARPLSRNAYKVKLARTALVRALTEVAGEMK